jgi:hypothetical protein
MFNLNIFEKKRAENQEMGIGNKEQLDATNLSEMVHYQELYSTLMDKDGIATDVVGAKNTAMELCKKYPDMVNTWAEEKDGVAKEGILQSMLMGVNKEQN